MSILCFLRKQSIEKSPISPENPVYKYNSINESIHYIGRIGKGGFDCLMMTLSFRKYSCSTIEVWLFAKPSGIAKCES
jgi:hypothetical protein